jgi:hypothetical protein
VNERRIVIVDRIAPGILVKKKGIAEEKIAKDQRADEDETTSDQQDGKAFQGEDKLVEHRLETAVPKSPA